MKDYNDNETKQKYSRRKFLSTLGATSAGLLTAPYLKSSNIFAYGRADSPNYLAQVAVTQATTYDRTLIKAKVRHLFESIGGISDLVRSGSKVGIKVNMTGGSPSVNMWTHPEILRAVVELLIESDVKAQDIYIVEATWSDSSFISMGYAEVIQSLGIQKINLNKAAPYNDFVTRDVGSKKFYYSSFKMNQILNDVDLFVSIPKMKQHYEAGFTGSIKNLIGTVPMNYYTMPNDLGRRGALHGEGGPSSTHLPKSICDLFLARPIHLAIIDGIVNARGGEGTWNPTFRPAEDHILMAGKDPVATDSVAAYFMGNNPELPKFQRPDGTQCDNHLYMLNQKGIGTNKMSEIEIVGDGAGLITSIRPDYDVKIPTEIKLLQNYPNPFNPATIIRFYIPTSENVTLKIYNINGQEIETLVDGRVPAGQHEFHWAANNIASGVYFYHMIAGNFADSKKMIYQK